MYWWPEIEELEYQMGAGLLDFGDPWAYPRDTTQWRSPRPAGFSRSGCGTDQPEDMYGGALDVNLIRSNHLLWRVLQNGGKEER